MDDDEIDKRKETAQRLIDVKVRRLDLTDEERDVVWAALHNYKSSLENLDLDLGERPSMGDV